MQLKRLEFPYLIFLFFFYFSPHSQVRLTPHRVESQKTKQTHAQDKLVPSFVLHQEPHQIVVVVPPESGQSCREVQAIAAAVQAEYGPGQLVFEQVY